MPRLRKYSDELRERAVRLVFESGRPIAPSRLISGSTRSRCAAGFARPRPMAAVAATG